MSKPHKKQSQPWVKKPAPAAKPSVMMLTPAYKGVSVSFASALAGILGECGRRGWGFSWVPVEGSSFLPHGRNLLANHFLQSDGYDVCFMLDADMSIAPEAFARMVDAEVDYVGAAGLIRRRTVGEPDTLMISVDPEAPRVNGLIETSVAMVACAVIRRSVFERLIAAGEARSYVRDDSGPFRDFFSPLFDGDLFLAEDVAFSRRCARAGIKQYVLADVDVEHAGATVNLAKLLDTGALKRAEPA